MSRFFLWCLALSVPVAISIPTLSIAQANESSPVPAARPVPKPVVRPAPVARPVPRPVVRQAPRPRPVVRSAPVRPAPRAVRPVPKRVTRSVVRPHPIAQPAPVRPKPIVRKSLPKRPQTAIAKTKPKVTAPPPARTTAISPKAVHRVRVAVPNRQSPPPARVVKIKRTPAIAISKQRVVPPVRRVNRNAISTGRPRAIAKSIPTRRLTPPPVRHAPKQVIAMAPPVTKGLTPATAPLFAPTPHQQAKGWLKRLLPNPSRMLFPLSVPAQISSAFGWRIHPISGQRRFHAGIDIAAPQGTPVVAVHEGKVAIADYLGGYGLQILLHHEGGKRATRYAHLSEIFVQSGQLVKQGTIIGLVGSTGYSTGPHLHFETLEKTPKGFVLVDSGLDVKLALSALIEANKLSRTPKSPPQQQRSVPLSMQTNVQHTVMGFVSDLKQSF